MEITSEEIVKLVTNVDTTVDVDVSNLTEIQEFYRNTNVFITGGTGFLGQILLEKLLRSCPVAKIYVLIRNKKGKNTEIRLEDIFNDPLFQRIKKQFPETRKKVVPIQGDCAFPDLDLCDQDKKLLIAEVDIIFHAAATVRFDENIKTAVHTNIRAPRDLLRLAHQMPRLKSFMHVSTLYSNCTSKVMEEDIYPPAANYEGLIAMVDSLPENILDNVTPRIIGSYPNTYAYTKQIAEDAVKQEGQGLPVGIQRPAIVVSTYKEPIRGWINNLYGPTGVVIGSGMGLIRVLHCDGECNANMVPVDMCVNSLIASAWDVEQTFKKAKDEKLEYKVPVYNFESVNDQPINWRTFMDLTYKYGVRYPFMKAIWYYSFSLQKYYPLYLILMFLLHTIPALLADGVLLCLGKPTMMIKAYKKIHKFSTVISFFCTNEWTVHSTNVQKLVGKMSERDGRIFFCNLTELDWVEFFKCYPLGARTHLLKESLDSLEKAKTRFYWLYWLHQITKTILGSLILWALWSLVTFIVKERFFGK